MDTQMVICSRCGKPFPKRRQELGYSYCISCSTEKPVVILVEGSLDDSGDCCTTMQVVSQEDALKIHSALKRYKTTSYREEDMPDVSTYEAQDDEEFSTQKKDSTGEGIQDSDETDNINPVEEEDLSKDPSEYEDEEGDESYEIQEEEEEEDSL